MKFTKYHSLTPDHQIDPRMAPNIKYIATEKLHGANFSFYIDETGVRHAKRTSFLTPEENFFNSHKMMQSYDGALSALYRDVKRKAGNVETRLIVYGELIGGFYPHPDIKASGAKSIQTGVAYNPEHRFVIFDMMVNETMLPVPIMLALCNTHHLRHVPILKIGTLAECLAVAQEEAPTIMPEAYALPQIANNIREGAVVRPYGMEQVKGFPIKIRTKQFSEGNGIKKRTKTTLPPSMGTYQAALTSYANPNRLNNLISKTGTYSKKDIGKMIGMMMADLKKDFIADHPDFTHYHADIQKYLLKPANRICAALVIDKAEEQ